MTAATYFYVAVFCVGVAVQWLLIIRHFSPPPPPPKEKR